MGAKGDTVIIQAQYLFPVHERLPCLAVCGVPQVLFSDKVRNEKYGRGIIILFQYRKGIFVKIAISVVEGERNEPVAGSPLCTNFIISARGNDLKSRGF